MANTALSAILVGVLATLTVSLAAVGGAGVAGQRAAGAADAAALAAADAVSGAISGDACVRAREVASAVGGQVRGCEVDGLIATVEVAVPFGALAAVARARAGPP